MSYEQTIPREIMSKARFLRPTSKKGRMVFSFTSHDSEVLMNHVGQLREESFSSEGGGTNKPSDVDVHDVHPKTPYHQLVVWDPANKEIIGGYRYQFMKDAPTKTDGDPFLASTNLVTFSDTFNKEYVPFTIELGRSFITPKHQAGKGGLFALDNLWDGLGTLIVDNPAMQYFFGKPTLYPMQNKHSRGFIYAFLERQFKDEESLVKPKEEYLVKAADKSGLEQLLGKEKQDVDVEFKILSNYLRHEYNESIPPLMARYMKLSQNMKSFGTAINNNFGQVEETAIIIPIQKIDEHILDRYTTY